MSDVQLKFLLTVGKLLNDRRKYWTMRLAVKQGASRSHCIYCEVDGVVVSISREFTSIKELRELLEGQV